VWANGTFGRMNPGDSSGSCCPFGEGVNGISNNGFLSGQNFDQGHVTAWFKSAKDEDFHPLNNDVVGTAVDSNSDVIGFTVAGKGFFAKHIEWNEGTNDATEVKPSFISVNFPHATATYPFGLSDKRMIGGTYVDSNGGIHGFVATPNF
jgi:hypothetical protein